MSRIHALCIALALAAGLAACSSDDGPDAPAATCGDAVVEAGEACDDGNLGDGDGCDSNCTVTACGNAIVTAGEACDDGNLGDGDGCDSSCTVTACGNAIVTAGEACDDGNLGDGDGCDSNCTVTACGNGVVTAGEACDDGNLATDDACLPTCVAAICGDGLVWTGVEACDDANAASGDGCDVNCTVTACGNGILTSGEACDDGNDVDTDGCTSACVAGVACDLAAFAAGERFAVDPATGHCYVAYDDDATTYTGATAACTAAGGHLVTITSGGEDALVTSILGEGQTPWLGAADDAVDTDVVFAWVTGEPWAYARFAEGEPDDDADAGGLGECLHVETAAGEWGDTACDVAGFVVGRICEFEPAPCGDGQLDPGEACDDGNLEPGDGCTACALDALWFSEYVEGSGSNKALEIRNPLPVPIDVSGCTVSASFNGGTGSGGSYALSGTVAAGGVLVVCNAQADAALLALCDLTTSSQALQFNGDDAVELACGGAAMDVIGQAGFDPGTEWGTDPVSTADATLRRRCAVTAGDANAADAFDPAIEWAGYPVDTFTDLGLATCVE